MFEAHHSAVLEFLRARSLLSEQQLSAIETDHEATGKSATTILLDNGWITRAKLWTELGKYLGLDCVGDCPETISDDLATLVSGEILLMPASWKTSPLRWGGT